MSDDKQPEPTPKEQQAQDQQRVQAQLIVTDVNRQVQNVMESFGFGRSGSSGRTSFEGHELNAMIDLIENSNPEHLEDAGEALLTARSAINKAADELSDFIKAVDWEGESGIAFRDWGNGLVAHAMKLGDFAETAGTQITVAGTGLASVRKSLPPRDNRLDRKSVEDIEAPKRIDGNPEYAAAVKVEKDRQEAINQANRLASYYSVSEETLAAQEPPRFEKKLDVAMPRPLNRIERTSDSGSSSRSAEPSVSSTTRGASEPTAKHEVSSSGNTRHRTSAEELGSALPVPDKGTSTEINSVAAPPAPVTDSGPSPTPSTTSPAGPGGGPTQPTATPLLNPVTGNSRRPTMSTGMPRAIGQPGNGVVRPGGSTHSDPGVNGRTGAPVGRPAPVSDGSGTTGRAGGGQAPVAGRSGVTGGRPTAGGHAGASGPSGPRVGRGSGIVGGTPQRAATNTGTPGGARAVPRGTVIGAGEAAQARGGLAGSAGRRGVIGAGGASGVPRPGGRGTPSSNGVVGTPRGGAAGTGSGTKGFTAGGAGLVRGPAGRGDSDREGHDGGTARPDYLTEDRETWEAGRRGVAPPVIE